MPRAELLPQEIRETQNIAGKMRRKLPKRVAYLTTRPIFPSVVWFFAFP
jgi:hypothetical protein